MSSMTDMDHGMMTSDDDADHDAMATMTGTASMDHEGMTSEGMQHEGMEGMMDSMQGDGNHNMEEMSDDDDDDKKVYSPHAVFQYVDLISCEGLV